MKIDNQPIEQQEAEMQMIEETWSWNDSLGDTVGEKNESLYIKMIQVRDKLGGVIEKVIVSQSWWDQIWSQCSFFKPYPITEHMPDGTIKVASFYNVYDMFLSDFYDDNKYWVAVVCPMGVGRIIIRDLI